MLFADMSLTPGRSITVDRRHEYGTPFFFIEANLMLCRALPLTLTKGILSTFASFLVRCGTTPAGCRLLAKGFSVCLARSGCARPVRTMKLFRTAFWLGVVIYNLPSPAPQPPGPESQLNGGQGLATKAARLPRPRES